MDAITPTQRAAIIHVFIVADKRQKSNPYALAHYCGALEHVEEMMTTGTTLRAALMSAFCGPMVNRLVKACGLTPLTETEIKQVR